MVASVKYTTKTTMIVVNIEFRKAEKNQNSTRVLGNTSAAIIPRNPQPKFTQDRNDDIIAFSFGPCISPPHLLTNRST